MTQVHRHITKGVTRQRLKLEARRGSLPTLFWVVTIALGLIAMSFPVLHVSQTFGRKTGEVGFVVDDSFGVFSGVDEVRFRGVPVGTIMKIERRGTQLILRTKIQKRFLPVYRNAKAEMRSVTPLNDVYLNITDPGTPDAGKATMDDPIRPGQTSALVTVPDVLDALGPQQRAGLHTLLDELGNGLDDRGRQLRRFFVETAPLIDSAVQLTDQVAKRDRITRRLVHNTAVLTKELGTRESQLRRLVATGAVTVGALQQESPSFDATLRALPPTVSDLRTTLQAVRRVAGDVDSGLTSLYPVADDLEPALHAALQLGGSLRPAARSLRPSVRALTPLTSALRPVARDLDGTVSVLRPQVPTLNKVTQRLVDCMTGIQNFMQWNTSLTKFGDSDAPIPRGQLAIGAPGLAPGLPARKPGKACAPGPVLTGRPMTTEDGH